MKSILFILPYFGKFPNYFSLFLNSCRANSSINWLLITDIPIQDLDIPNNVFLQRKTFEEIQQLIALKFQIRIQRPYDLCKFRVAYADLFPEALDYDFWGFCDCDLIWGNLRDFITDDILRKYDKISWRGHMTLFRNDLIINSMYKKVVPGLKTFRGCIENTEGINLFDEVGINKIFDYYRLPIYKNVPFADLKIRSANFKCLHNIFAEKTNRHQIFRWHISDGLERISTDGNKIISEKIAYVHFLKRSMQFKGLKNMQSFLIIPNKFIEDRSISMELLMYYSRDRIYWSYWLSRLTLKYILRKIIYICKNRNNIPDKY